MGSFEPAETPPGAGRVWLVALWGLCLLLFAAGLIAVVGAVDPAMFARSVPLAAGFAATFGSVALAWLVRTRVSQPIEKLAAGRLDAAMRTLESAHLFMLARDASFEALHAATESRAVRAIETLERTAALQDADRARMQDVMAVANEALIAMRGHLDALAMVDPTRVETVLATLDDRIAEAGAKVHASLKEDETARREVRLGSEALVGAANALGSYTAEQSAVAQDVARELRTLIEGIDAKLSVSVAKTGAVAARVLIKETAPMREAAAEHAAWLRVSLTRMREETETIIGARNAAEAVRLMSPDAEEQLRAMASGKRGGPAARRSATG